MKICPKCNKEHLNLGTFCSRSCANSRGPRTEEFKKIVSSKLSGRIICDEVRLKITDDNHPKRKGKNLPPLEKECLFCSKIFKKTTSKYCSKKCWMFSIEMQRTVWEKYHHECSFKFNVYEYPQHFDLSLIEQHGWYKAKNRGDNLDGISKDHIFSVKDGFINSIDPKIISHPANCKLVRHTDNQKKKTKSFISLKKLQENIEKFNILYGLMAE